MSRKPRLCIFCGANANSKEHIWPTWLHDLLGPVPDWARHNKELHNYTPKAGLSVTGAMGRQGDQRNVRVRAVCATCNNGWMNQLEGKVRPFLTPLVTGEHTTLDGDGLTALSRWLSLKIIVSEHDAENMALTPQSDRERFWKTGTLPSYFRLYVAHNISDDPLFFMRHSHCMALDLKGPNPPLDGTAKNVQVVTMVVGKAVFQAVCSRTNGFTLEDKATVLGFHNRCQIWPNPPKFMNFPSRPNLNAEGILNVATFLERLIARGNFHWIE